MIKVLSLFSGIGAFENALRRIGQDYELVNYCEIDKYASKAYSLLYDVSEDLNLGDITKVDVDKLPTDIDILTHGSPCFTGDTFVLTSNGYKYISDINIGDYVIDHTNRYNKVVNVFDQGQKEIWEINAMCSDIIRTTENHKLLVRTKSRVWNNGRRSYDRKFSDPEWKQCKDLTKDDYLGIAINQNSKIPEYDGVDYVRGNHLERVCNLDMTDKRLWYICGRYLGDGWIRNRKDRNNHVDRVIICCGKHEEGQIENEIGDLFNYSKVEERTTFKYHICNRELALFLEQFGHGAKNKFIPGFMYDLPKQYIIEFLRGYWDSDGYVNKNGVYIASSISRQLVYGIAQLIAKAYNRPYSIYHTKRKPTCVIEERVVNQNDSYIVTFKKNKSKQDHAFYEDGYLWVPINKIKRTGTYENVYDIEVENTHSFTANGAIVHNCQSFSVAGEQAGGDEGSGTQSSLMWYSVNIIKHVKPKIVLWENVKNVLSPRHKHNFDKYISMLDDFGYNSNYKVLNAKDFGVPQNRERVFIVSIRNDIDLGLFEFPKPMELTLRLKDVLEDNVDEKFYLSDEYMQRFLNSNLKMNGDIKILGTTVGTGKGTNSRHWVHDINGIVGALSATDYKQPKQILEPKVNQLGNCMPGTNRANPNQGRVYDVNGLSPTLSTMQGGNRQPMIIASRGRYKEDGSTEQHFEPNYEGLCNTITTVQKDNYVLEPKSMIIDDTYGYDGVRFYDEYSPSLRASRSGLKTLDQQYRIRKLTPRECWRLMGFHDEDFDKVNGIISNTQLYKQAGNSIIVNVLEAIFKNLFEAVDLEDD